MATANPMQDFIANFMQIYAMGKQEEQFKAELAERKRLGDLDVIGQFSDVLQYVENPEQRSALVQQYAQQQPHLAETFRHLGDSIPISERVYQSNIWKAGAGQMTPQEQGDVGEAAILYAMTGQSPSAFRRGQIDIGRPAEEIGRELRIAGDLELGATGQEGARQFGVQETRLGSQFDRTIEQQRNEFERTIGQRISEFTQTHALDEFQTAQQGELGRLGILASANLLPLNLMSEQSRMLAQKQALYDQQKNMMTPEARAAAEREIRELGASMSMLQKVMMPTGSGGAGSAFGMTPAQVVEAVQTAERAMGEASAAEDQGRLQSAVEMRNQLREMLRRMNPELFGTYTELGDISGGGWLSDPTTNPAGVVGAPALLPQPTYSPPSWMQPYLPR